MRTWLTLLSLLFVSANHCQGQPSDSLFQRAKALELEWKVGEACIIYDTLVQRGYRVDEIQSMRIYRMHRQLEDRYKQERDAGDGAFAKSNFAEAREAYMRALGIKPEDEYSKQQIARIDEQLSK
jgi:hypothetical protein